MSRIWERNLFSMYCHISGTLFASFHHERNDKRIHRGDITEGRSCVSWGRAPLSEKKRLLCVSLAGHISQKYRHARRLREVKQFFLDIIRLDRNWYFWSKCKWKRNIKAICSVLCLFSEDFTPPPEISSGFLMAFDRGCMPWNKTFLEEKTVKVNPCGFVLCCDLKFSPVCLAPKWIVNGTATKEPQSKMETNLAMSI